MKILVAFNDPEISQRALTVAQKRAKAMNAELHLFTSTSGDDASAAEKACLKDAEMMCSACGIVCQIHISKKDESVADDLIACAQENQIDETVIGLRGRSNIGKLIFGPTSRRVILEAPCPVLTVK